MRSVFAGAAVFSSKSSKATKDSETRGIRPFVETSFDAFFPNPDEASFSRAVNVSFASCASAASAAERASVTGASGRPRNTTDAWWFRLRSVSIAACFAAAALPPPPPSFAAATATAEDGGGGSFAPSLKMPCPPRPPSPSTAPSSVTTDDAEPKTPKSPASAAKLTSALTRFAVAARCFSVSGLRAKSARSAASCSPCGGAPARAALKYSLLKNRVQNSRSVMFFGTFSKNAARTAGRSAKILCIFSFESVAVTTSPPRCEFPAPLRAPLMSASSTLEMPVFWVAPFFNTASVNKSTRALQNSSSSTAARELSSSFAKREPLTSRPCAAASSGLDASRASLAASSAADVFGGVFFSFFCIEVFDDGPPVAVAALMASLSASRSGSLGNCMTNASGLAPGAGPGASTKRRLARFEPGLFRWWPVTRARSTTRSPSTPAAAGRHTSVEPVTLAAPSVIDPATLTEQGTSDEEEELDAIELRFGGGTISFARRRRRSGRRARRRRNPPNRVERSGSEGYPDLVVRSM